MDAIDGVARELVHVLRAFKGLHADVTERLGTRLELPAMAVLVTLAERGPSRASALAEVLRLDLSSVSRQVAALEREGWLDRDRDPADNRASLLDLSPAGKDLVERLGTARGHALRAVLTDWSPAELDGLADSLEHLARDLAAAYGGTAASPAGAPAARARRTGSTVPAQTTTPPEDRP